MGSRGGLQGGVRKWIRSFWRERGGYPTSFGVLYFCLHRRDLNMRLVLPSLKNGGSSHCQIQFGMDIGAPSLSDRAREVPHRLSCLTTKSKVVVSIDRFLIEPEVAPKRGNTADAPASASRRVLVDALTHEALRDVAKIDWSPVSSHSQQSTPAIT